MFSFAIMLPVSVRLENRNGRGRVGWKSGRANKKNITDSLFCLFGPVLLRIPCCALSPTYLQLETEMRSFVDARTWVFVRHQAFAIFAFQGCALEIERH